MSDENEARIRVQAIERWAQHALAGDCPLDHAITAIGDLAMAARLHLVEAA
jgi:hypothetical protein